MENYKGIVWDSEDIIDSEAAACCIFAIYGIDELWTAVHECDFGSLNTNKVIEELDPEFYDYLGENAEMIYY